MDIRGFGIASVGMEGTRWGSAVKDSIFALAKIEWW